MGRMKAPTPPRAVPRGADLLAQEAAIGQAHGGPRHRLRNRLRVLHKKREEMAKVFEDRISANRDDVTSFQISQQVCDRIGDDEKTIQLLAAVGSCVGSKEGKTFLAAALGTDEAEFGVSASTAPGGGGTALSGLQSRDPLKQGCKVFYDHNARIIRLGRATRASPMRLSRTASWASLVVPTSVMIQDGSRRACSHAC